MGRYTKKKKLGLYSLKVNKLHEEAKSSPVKQTGDMDASTKFLLKENLLPKENTCWPMYTELLDKSSLSS